MTSEELADFLRGEQKMKDVTSDFCREVIETYEPSESKLAGLLSHDGTCVQRTAARCQFTRACWRRTGCVSQLLASPGRGSDVCVKSALLGECAALALPHRQRVCGLSMQ